MAEGGFARAQKTSSRVIVSKASVDIRPLGPEHSAEILSVVEGALGIGFRGGRTPEWWAWKHQENPFGRSYLLGAFDGDQLVGVRAFLQWTLSLGESRLRCVRAVDTATLPAYQGKGIFRRLTLAALEQVHGDGIGAVFNTPNSKSGSGYLKMGWKTVSPLKVALRPSGVGGLFRMLAALLGRSATASNAGRAADHRLPSFSTWFDGLSAAGRSQVVASLRRQSECIATAWDEAALRWRFANNPVADYRVLATDDLANWAVIRLNERRGLREGVVSLACVTRGRLSVLLKHAAEDVDYWIWRPGDVPGRAMAAWRNGFVPLPLKAMNLVTRQVVASDAEFAVLLSPENWYLEFADLELL